ncbi:MAG TPA: hypothetical protein VGG18_00905 [Granulicella sp.]|jgi:hypothetical protein
MSEPKKTIDPRLNACFAKFSKPAQRALLQHKIFSASDLAQWSRGELAKLHGIGPASFPMLERVLAEAGLKFKD